MGTPPDFELLLAPATVAAVQGTVRTVGVTIDRNNFVGGVALFLTGAPANVSGTFVPGTTNSSASTLTLTIGTNVTPGSYTLMVNGNGAPGQRSTALPLTVTPAPSYTLELTPATLTIARGSSDSTTLTITRSNFAGAITLSLGNVPAGVTSAFNPASPTTNSSLLTLTVSAGATPGTYNLTVDGTAAAGDRTAALTLTIQ
jgi:hypothetical protein